MLGHKSKSITGKEPKDEKKKKTDEDDVGFKMSPSNFLQELMLASSEYEEVWKGMDETSNSSQRHIESIVKAQKVAEVEQELRKVALAKSFKYVNMKCIDFFFYAILDY